MCVSCLSAKLLIFHFFICDLSIKLCLKFFCLVYRYVLESEHMKKFFYYIQLPNFDVAADATATFKVSSSYKIQLYVIPT